MAIEDELRAALLNVLRSNGYEVTNPDGSTTVPVTVIPKPAPVPNHIPDPGTVIVPSDELSNIEKQAKMTLSKYNKFIVAFVGLLFAYLLRKYGATAWVQDLEYLATAVGIFQIPNF